MAFTRFEYLQCTRLDAVMLITQGSDCSHILTTICSVILDCGWASALALCGYCRDHDYQAGEVPETYPSAL
jgi:hypothetical protein